MTIYLSPISLTKWNFYSFLHHTLNLDPWNIVFFEQCSKKKKTMRDDDILVDVHFHRPMPTKCFKKNLESTKRIAPSRDKGI
jgi:hypothetical protein